MPSSRADSPHREGGPAPGLQSFGSFRTSNSARAQYLLYVVPRAPPTFSPLHFLNITAIIFELLFSSSLEFLLCFPTLDSLYEIKEKYHWNLQR